MSKFKRHRLWLFLLALALLIGATAQPLLTFAQQEAASKRAHLRTEILKNRQALSQLQEDIAATEKLKRQITDKEAEDALPPVDRLRVAQSLERRAVEAHLTHLIYTIAPEEKVVIDTPSAEKQNLACSKITLNADAPTDKDAYRFLDSVRHTLPGRVTFQTLSVTRLPTAEGSVTASNVHLTAEGNWLSNGANPHLEEKRP